MSKSSKRRDCPALAKVITSAECGAGRQGAIACPPDCGFNPFGPAAYDHLLEIEPRLDRRTMQAWTDEVGESYVGAIIRGSQLAGHVDEGNAAIVKELFFRRDDQGRAFAERWLASGAKGLTQDERVFLAGKAGMRPALLEVLAVRADGLLSVVDLLDPDAKPVLVQDRSIWARTVRYEVLLALTYPLPHYWRLTGALTQWPEWQGMDLTPVEQLHEIMGHLGGPDGDAPLADRREWLVFHFDEVLKTLRVVDDVRRRDLLEAIDADWGWSEYRLDTAEMDRLRRGLAGEKRRARVGKPDEEDVLAGFDGVWDWSDSQSPFNSETAHAVLGCVLLGKGVVRLRAMGRSRHARLQAEVLTLLGQPHRRPDRELTQELGRQHALKIPESDLAQVPPRLRGQPESMELKSFMFDAAGSGKPAEELAKAHIELTERQWLDNTIPGLDGRTPREAIKEPLGRAKVVRMVKERICIEDRDRLRGRLGLRSSMELVRELGLTELEGPPPPDRPCPADWLDERDEQAEDSKAPGAGVSAPLWLGRALTEDEFFSRLDEVEKIFTYHDDLIEAWSQACPALASLMVQDLDDLPGTDMMEITLVVASAWAVLGGVSVGRELRLDPARIRLRYVEADQAMRGSAATEPDGAPFAGLCASQQKMAFGLLAELHQRVVDTGRDGAQISELFALAIVWLHATLEELERALGRSS